MIPPLPSNAAKARQDNFWLPPYGYAQSLVAVVGAWSAGTLLQVIKGAPPPMTWPFNAWALALLIALLAAIHARLRHTALHAWLTSVPFALCVFGGVVALAILGGVIPQTPDVTLPALMKSWGWHQIFVSWPFGLLMLLLLVSLGLTVLKNVSFRSLHWAATSCSHLGLWIALATGFLGAGDLTRADLVLPEGQAGRVAHDARGQAVVLPFEVFLRAFELEAHPPTALWVSSQDGEPIQRPHKSGIPLNVGETATLDFKGARYQMVIEHVLPYARWIRDPAHGRLTFAPSRRVIDAPAAYVSLTRQVPDGRPTRQNGWLTRGGATSLPQTLSVGDVAVAMTEINPKRFASRVLWRPADSKRVQANVIEVNRPVDILGWRLYQKSYEQPIGMGQSISILEAIRDPWLPAVYTGLGLMTLGALLALAGGARQRLQEKTL